MMIDVHCHLTDEAFQNNLDQIIAEAKEVGVRAFISSGLGFKDSLKVLEISDYHTIYPAIGIMPYDLRELELVIDLIEKNSDKIVAIGEVGLDYYASDETDRKVQEKALMEFIELARRLNLPLVIHSRSAGKYALQILIENRAEKVVMHAFDGSASHAEKGVEKGYFFSIPPSINRSQQKQKLVKRLPLDNLLLESDAPALAPNPNEVNKPSNIRISAEWISRLKSIPVSKVEEKTTENAIMIFNVKIT